MKYNNTKHRTIRLILENQNPYICLREMEMNEKE